MHYSPGSRDIMSDSVSSRRTPSKPQYQDRPAVTSPEKVGGRWRYNGTGQFVEAPSEWELVDEMSKMGLSANGGDGHVPIRTPPQSKANTAAVVHLHETSPLETGSDDSLDSNSPHPRDQSLNLAAHSRGSSADTTGSTHGGTLSNGQTLRAYTPLKQAGGSPNGKGDAWSPPNGTPERQADPLTYPSISLASPRQPDFQQSTRAGAPGSRADEYQPDYSSLPSQFNQHLQGQPPLPSAGPAPGYVVGRSNGVAANMSYRQPVRGFTPQVQVPPVLQSATNFAYPAPLHPVPMINNAQQQLYDMMLPTAPLDNATLARMQQQHNANVYRSTHQHSASDPASLRDPATLALLNNNLQAQAFAARQMFPTAMGPPGAALSMFPNQFYGAPQEAFSSPDLASVQMMAQIQTQYTGPYGVPVTGQSVNIPSPTPAQIAVLNQMNINNGPSANNRKLGLYKTELCRSWEEKGTCRYGAKCQFAHGEEELRKVTRHPKYKTEICRTFWVSGSCPYGKRCCFIHTELPASGAPPGADGAPPPPTSQEGRARSASTNSDPNEGPGSSLLARISAKRSQEGTLNSGSGSVSTTPPSTGYQVNSRPVPGALRVDTSVLDAGAASKQNKSAYPTFAHNGILLPAAEETTARSPGPVTAGPDFGRHASARMDIVGSQQQRGGKGTANTNVRHSFNGSDIQLDFSATTPTASNSQAQFGLSSSPEAPKTTARINGHVRSGSAGNWGSATSSRTNHLAAYPLSSIPGGELKHTSPWGDYSLNNNRIAEQNWA